MARTKSSRGQPVTLFPFLAVLICVMGALIFLLLATTRRMRELAVIERTGEISTTADAPILPSFADEELPLPLANLGESAVPPPLEDQQVPMIHEAQAAREAMDLSHQLVELERNRADLDAELQRRRQQHDSAQRLVDELQDSAGNLQTKLRGALADLKSAKSDDTSDDAIPALEERIVELRRKLRQLRNRPAEGETKFAVVPFDARSGTTRRPILIECTDDGLRFLPEDVVVRPSDLEGFTDRYNPLVAGAEALVNYWSEQDRLQTRSDQNSEPYVLLIVRPGGTVGYYVAMKMLNGLQQPFGYELIDESIDLQLPAVDPHARQVCQDAVAGRISEREAIARRVQGTFRRGRSAGADTFEVTDVVPAEQPVSEGSWQNIERFEGRRPNAKSSPTQQSESIRPAKTATAQRAAKNPAKPETVSPIPVSAQGSRAAPRELDDSTENLPPSTPLLDRQTGQSPAQANVRLEQLSRRKWGDSEASATIGVEKDVTIRVDGQRIVIAEERVIHQHPGEKSLDLFLRVMEAVDAESRTWGKPRPGFYWTPRLRFVISPGGNQVFERIDPLAMRSGLATTREFTLDAAAPAATEGLR